MQWHFCPWEKENKRLLVKILFLGSRTILDYPIVIRLVESNFMLLDVQYCIHQRPEGQLKFWDPNQDHGNYIPSRDLTKAIAQAIKYIYEIEREANSVKFLERVGHVKAIKPRCTLIFGRSDNWNDEQREAYRILNSSYHNLTILTYDHVLERAKRILELSEE